MNFKKIFGLYLFLLISPGFLAFAFDDGDFQYWNTEKIVWKISDNWSGSLEEELYLGNNASNLYYHHTDLGFTYSGLAEWLDLGFNYRQVFEDRNGSWESENRPHFNLTVKGNAFGYSWSDLSRFEYRNRESAEDFWCYRNKFTLKMPCKFTKFQIQPYVADEWFYDFNVESLNRNRLYTGITFKLMGNVGADIFYMWQSSKTNDDWDDTNVLGTKLTVNF